MSTTKQREQCQHVEYYSPFQSFNCNFEGDCPDKIKTGDKYNCKRAFIIDREDLARYELEEVMRDELIKRQELRGF